MQCVSQSGSLFKHEDAPGLHSRGVAEHVLLVHIAATVQVEVRVPELVDALPWSEWFAQCVRRRRTLPAGDTPEAVLAVRRIGRGLR